MGRHAASAAANLLEKFEMIEKHRASPLAMRPPEAAKALGISERLLSTWTREGLVPYTRLGRTVLYPVTGLTSWLESRAQMQSKSTVNAEQSSSSKGDKK